jgi:hypothetical protein
MDMLDARDSNDVPPNSHLLLKAALEKTTKAKLFWLLQNLNRQEWNWNWAFLFVWFVEEEEVWSAPQTPATRNDFSISRGIQLILLLIYFILLKKNEHPKIR